MLPGRLTFAVQRGRRREWRPHALARPPSRASKCLLSPSRIRPIATLPSPASNAGKLDAPPPPHISRWTMSWSTPCAAAPPPGPGFASISATSPKTFALLRKRPIPMTIPPANGANCALAVALRRPPDSPSEHSPRGCENRSQFVRRHDFQLFIRAVLRSLIRSPPAEMCHVAETRTLHMLVGHLCHQHRLDGLP